MIIGICASGRKDGVTGEAVRAILEASGLLFEYISLQEKRSADA
jgi:hypothetical protein